MTNEHSEEASGGSPFTEIAAENPMILDKVDYVYVAYAQVGVNNLDYRIAFGDRLPPEGRVKPVVGIVMSHDHAKALFKALSTSVPQIDALLEQVARTQKHNPELIPPPQGG